MLIMNIELNKLDCLTIPELLECENKPAATFMQRDKKLIKTDAGYTLETVYYYTVNNCALMLDDVKSVIAVREQSGLDRVNKTEDVAQSIIDSLIVVANEYRDAVMPRFELQHA